MQLLPKRHFPTSHSTFSQIWFRTPSILISLWQQFWFFCLLWLKTQTCSICMHVSNIHIWKGKEGIWLATHFSSHSLCQIWWNYSRHFLHLLNNTLCYLTSKNIKPLLKNLLTLLIVYHSILMMKMVTSQLHFNLCHITPSTLYMSLHLIHQLL